MLWEEVAKTSCSGVKLPVFIPQGCSVSRGMSWEDRQTLVIKALFLHLLSPSYKVPILMILSFLIPERKEPVWLFSVRLRNRFTGCCEVSKTKGSSTLMDTSGPLSSLGCVGELDPCVSSPGPDTSCPGFLCLTPFVVVPQPQTLLPHL